MRRLEDLLSHLVLIGEGELQSIMSDHGLEKAEGDDMICHGPTVGTVASTQYFPKYRLLRIAKGSPCSAQYQNVEFLP